MWPNGLVAYAMQGSWERHSGAPDPELELQNWYLAEECWNDSPQWVIAPYAKGNQSRAEIPSNAEYVKLGVNLRGPPRKAKYFQATDSALVP